MNKIELALEENKFLATLFQPNTPFGQLYEALQEAHDLLKEPPSSDENGVINPTAFERDHWKRVAEIEHQSFAEEAGKRYALERALEDQSSTWVIVEQLRVILTRMARDKDDSTNILGEAREFLHTVKVHPTPLEEHDRAVAEKAWERGYDDLRKHLASLGHELHVGYTMASLPNPYKK